MFKGKVTSIFFKLFCLAPLMVMNFFDFLLFSGMAISSVPFK